MKSMSLPHETVVGYDAAAARFIFGAPVISGIASRFLTYMPDWMGMKPGEVGMVIVDAPPGAVISLVAVTEVVCVMYFVMVT